MGKSDLLYPVSIQVQAWDRVGLVRDVTTLVAEEKVNIASVNLADGDGHNITLYLTLETTGLAQLSQLLKKIDAVNGVISVMRIGNDTAKKNPSRTQDSPDKGEEDGTKKN